MQKYIFITNGSAGSGKDSFANIMKEYIPTFKYSSIELVKQMAMMAGWDGTKTERDRKFLSDLKCLTTNYYDTAFNDICRTIDAFLETSFFERYRVLLIDIREPEEIERVRAKYNASTILITRDSVPHITSNMGDANVYNYSYDHIIDNSGTLEDLEVKVKEFIKENIYEKESK